MTFTEVRYSLLKRWWLILAFGIGFTLLFFPWSTAVMYNASIGMGATFNSQAFAAEGENYRQAYVDSMEQLSLYLFERFNSVEIQNKIASEGQLPVSNFKPGAPFYQVTNQNGGFVTLTFTTQSQELAARFLDASKKVYEELIILERNLFELEAFKIDPSERFIENIAQSTRSAQFRVLPTISGILLALVLALIIPIELPKVKQAQ